jgi:multimeric flavodoxin WrbA
LAEQGIDTVVLVLSRLVSDYGRVIHPCKGCVSTAMPLCHWPCSCYPNHALGQSNDWMAEIYERWVAAHGVLLLTPTYWYQAPSPLKLMIDRLVCADGGNPDPTRTDGKDAEVAKELELAGWPYPKHLAGRVFGVVVHGDVAGIESVRRALCDWLAWMGLRRWRRSSRRRPATTPRNAPFRPAINGSRRCSTSIRGGCRSAPARVLRNGSARSTPSRSR